MHWLFEFSEDDSALDGFSTHTFKTKIYERTSTRRPRCNQGLGWDADRPKLRLWRTGYG